MRSDTVGDDRQVRRIHSLRIMDSMDSREESVHARGRVPENRQTETVGGFYSNGRAALLLPQRDYLVHSGRAPGGNVAGLDHLSPERVGQREGTSQLDWDAAGASSTGRG
jgi:hypothetical protein